MARAERLATRAELLATWLVIVGTLLNQVAPGEAQLPDDIQRELNQNLAEQARIQAMRARHQQQIQARAGNQQPAKPAHDPNNYSYQQVSPPIQYSYYQPYGDAAQQPAGGGGGQGQQLAALAGKAPAQAAPQINVDLNNLNFDLPTPQARVGPAPGAPPQTVPSFTGAAGLPVLQPMAAAQQGSPDGYAPAGQARVQQGPPLTEADFKDITGGENYGAPGGSDFGMNGGGGGDAGGADQAPDPSQSAAGGDQTDAQLREFGMPDERRPAARRSQANDAMQMNIPDFGGFNPLGGPAAATGPQRRQPSNPMADFGGVGLDSLGAGFGGGRDASGGGGPSSGPANEFDFASQPSTRAAGGGDQAQAAQQGGAPGSLQSLLGGSFPGLGGNQMGLDALSRGGNAPETQLDRPQRAGRADDGALDIADMGDKSDGFSGADLGGFEQPSPQNDQDFNYAAAAEQQPRSVPYPDGGPQAVGALFALTQPQSLSQARYNPMPDKGTYQNYPAYESGGNDFSAVRDVVNSTPRARPPAPGRYGHPPLEQLAPEHRHSADGAHFDYSQTPGSAVAASSDDDDSFADVPNFVKSEGDNF